MVIKGNGAVNTMEAVKINTKEKERTKVTYHKSVFSSVLTGITWGAAILALAILVFLVGFILIRGVKNLTLEQFAWTYNTENVTMLPAIINTVTMTVLSLLLAAPLGIFSAIYLVEYANKRGTLVGLIRITAETLSGIPSIVYGLFGMLFFTKTLKMGYSMMSGACTLAIMILPLIMRTAEEALKSVPDSYREASFGLGAGKLRTIFKIVLPSAVPGILSGVILATGRVVGETAALLFTAGTIAKVAGLMDSGRTLAVHMYALSSEGLYMNQMYATGVILMLIVLLINGCSGMIAKKIAIKERRGKNMSKIDVSNMDLYYGDFHALKNINLSIDANEVTAFIGPSGCGKSTLLKSINRMNDLVPGCRITGEMLLDGENIYGGKMDVNGLRKRVGMVFQKPNPFPMSIYDNIAYGPRTHGVRSKAKLDDIVEQSLRQAAIWDEVKDRLKKSALGMSGGQQQRLCIARALAVQPEVLLMDEPTSALDPISTSKIEDLAVELKKDYTIIMVTHNMQQAARISDKTAFFLLGEVVEYGETEQIFSMPKDKRTEDYITGRFG